MKTLLSLLFAVNGFCAVSQLTKDLQFTIDSLLGVVHNTNLPADERASAYNRIAWNCVYQDYQVGRKYCIEYQAFAAKHGLVHREIAALHFLGYTQLMLGQTDASELSYQRSLELALEYKNVSLIAHAYADLGNLKYRIHDPTGALVYHKKCLALAQKNKLKVVVTRALINIGEIYEAQGLYNQSLASFQQAKSIAEFNLYVGYYSSIHEHLGDVNRSIEEYQIAEKHYRLALKYAIEHLNVNRRIRSLKKIAQLHQALNRFDSAMSYFNQALDLSLKYEVQSLLPSTRSGIAGVLFVQGNHDAALKMIVQSLNDYKRSDTQEELEEALLLAGKIYFKGGQYSKSEVHFKQSYDLALKSNQLNTLKASVFGLYEVYKQTGRSKLALQYYEAFDTYRSKLRSENEIKEILKMEIASDFKNRAIADSLEQLRKMEKMGFDHRRAEDKSRFNFYMSLAGIVFLSLALVLTAYILFQKRKSTRELNRKNVTINQALKDKEVLLKEVHHRVKNNMQVVSSLLYLKSNNAPNEMAKEALIDSKKRIDSMQLSHQRMYQNDDYEHLDVVAYSNDIFHMLLDPIQSENDHFEVEGGVQMVHVEKSQALGYIIHEFVVNSIKHAWPEQANKRIHLNFERTGTKLKLSYHDNGIGLPAQFNIKTSKSFGMKVVNSLVARQLQGTIEVLKGSGATIIIEFGTELEPLASTN